MPKMVGHTPADLDPRPEAVTSPLSGDVALSLQQIRFLRPARERGLAVRAMLDKSDRGGPRQPAKRWYRWYVDARELLALAHEETTPAMRKRAERHLAVMEERAAWEARAASRGLSVAELHRVEMAEQQWAAAHAKYPWVRELAAEIARDPSLSGCVRVGIGRGWLGLGDLAPMLTEALHDAGGSMTFVEGINGCRLPRTLPELRAKLESHMRIYHSGRDAR